MCVADEEKETSVHGIITSKGLFEGKITTANDTYVVERASRYFPDASPDFHSVIYRHSDVHMPHFDSNNGSLCKAEILQQKLKQWQDNRNKHPGKSKQPMRQISGTGAGEKFEKTLSGVSLTDEGLKYEYLNFRSKRSTVDPRKTTCTLYVQADHLFYQKFDRNMETVIEQLTQHVQGVNDIYHKIGEFSAIVVPLFPTSP